MTNIKICIIFFTKIITFIGDSLLKKPWDYNPDLTEDRIVELANFIVTVREEVIEMHDEELGDTRLSLGMRAYECCRSRLISLSDSGKHTWLSILTPERRFTFCIGQTPVRFTRNDPRYLPNKKLLVSEEAGKKFKQLSLFPENPCEDSAIRWFFVIDTYYKNPADVVYFVGYDESGFIQSQWLIPIEAKVSILSTLDDVKSKPIDIPAAKVRLKQNPRIKAKIDNGK